MQVPLNDAVAEQMANQALDGYLAAWADGVMDPHERAMHEAQLRDLIAETAANAKATVLALGLFRVRTDKTLKRLTDAAIVNNALRPEWEAA